MADLTFNPGSPIGIPYCMKTDCVNRDKVCRWCVRYSHYLAHAYGEVASQQKRNSEKASLKEKP